MNKSTLAAVRDEFARYDDQNTAVAGHTHLQEAIDLATEFLESDASAEEKQVCLKIVRRYAEQLKRRCAALLENWQSSKREDLGLAFANLELFDGYDFGFSDEFVRLRSKTELTALIMKRPFAKWTERDHQEFDRLMSALKRTFDREK